MGEGPEGAEEEARTPPGGLAGESASGDSEGGGEVAARPDVLPRGRPRRYPSSRSPVDADADTDRGHAGPHVPGLPQRREGCAASNYEEVRTQLLEKADEVEKGVGLRRGNGLCEALGTDDGGGEGKGVAERV